MFFYPRVTPVILYQPHVWLPQRQPVEMAFVSEDKLFRAVFGIDDGLVLLSILLISLQSRP